MPELAEIDVITTRLVEAGTRLGFNNTYDSTHGVTQLWNEICNFRTVVSHGAQSLPDLHQFECQDALQAMSFITSARNTFSEIEKAVEGVVHSLQNSEMPQVPNEQTLRRCCDHLRKDRLGLTSSLDRLQSYQLQHMIACMKDPEILEFCHQVNNGTSENTHIACLDPADDNSSLNLDGRESQPEILDYTALRTQDSRRWKHWAYFGRLLRGHCPSNCRCKCHEQSPHACPSGLSRVFQRLFPRLNSNLFLINQCSKISCRNNSRNNSAWRGQITVVIHSVIMKKAILFCAIARGLRFKFYIRDYPLVSGGSVGTRCAQIGDVIGMKKLFRTGKASIRDVTSDGWSYLHESTFHGHTELVKFLLAEGADPDDAEIKLRKASHFAKFRALSVGASDAEKSLAGLFPNDQDFRDDFQLSAILTTILREYDHSDLEKPTLKDIEGFAKRVMESFPDKNWDAWMREYQGRSPVYQDLIRSLQKSTADGNSCSATFLSLIGQPDALQGWKPLQWAAFIGRLDDFKLLLMNGADPFAITTSGRNIIHQAAETGAVEILGYLLQNDFHKQGLDINLPDIWGETPLHNAAAKSPAGAKLLVTYQADREARQSDGQVPLHYARYLKGKKRVQVLTALLERGGPQINTRDGKGRSPIFYFLDSLESVSLLLDHGADVLTSDSEGNTVIHLICAEGRPSLLKMVLDRCPADAMTAKSNDGDTPLFTSFRNHSFECVKILLKRARIPFLEDRQGWSLVHHAVEMGDPSVLEDVLKIPGIDIYSKNKLGKNAFDIAADMGTRHQRIGEILDNAALCR